MSHIIATPTGLSGLTGAIVDITGRNYYITTARHLYSTWRDQQSAEGHADWASNRTTWPETCRERATKGQSYTRRRRSACRWVSTSAADGRRTTQTATPPTGRCSIYRHCWPVMLTMAPVRPVQPVMYSVIPSATSTSSSEVLDLVILLWCYHHHDFCY